MRYAIPLFALVLLSTVYCTSEPGEDLYTATPLPATTPTPSSTWMPVVSPMAMSTESPKPQPTPPPQPGETPELPMTPESLQMPTPIVGPSQTATPTVAPTATAALSPNTYFGDGTWRVRWDIPPDIYVAPGGENCDWVRLGGSDRTDEFVIAEMPPTFVAFGWNNLRQVVVIDSSDSAFRTEDCGQWRPLSESTTPVDTIPDGIWVVDNEIPIGTYASIGGDECQWVHFSGFDWSTDSLLAAVSNYGRQLVDLNSPASTLLTVGCGEWRPLSGSITQVDPIPDGIWVVGDEISPGVYASSGGKNCFWGRLQEFDDYFTEEGRGTGRQIVEIEDGDRAFGTQGCDGWSPLSESITPVEIIPDGAWMVGQEAPPPPPPESIHRQVPTWVASGEGLAAGWGPGTILGRLPARAGVRADS